MDPVSTMRALVWLLATLPGQGRGSDTGYRSAGAGPLRLAEAEQLLRASKDAIASLPAGHPAKDEVRSFHSKLTSLHSAASLTEAAEWDAMLHALLEAEYYGAESLIRLLGKPTAQGGVSATERGGENCDSADGGEPAAGSAGGSGRRLDSGGEEDGARREGSEAEDSWGASAALGAVRRALYAQQQAWLEASPSPRKWLAAWWRDLMNRPPPWERDCDCCFKMCPAEHHCLYQSDGLYLACRGESVGEILDYHWTRRPITCSVTMLVAVVGTGLWIRQQARIFSQG
uniref:Uncharacterized protein n=1 Tax=Haptolina ericina TaxID=156174 RepID=A0A7S3ETC1_9EUKA